MAEMLLGTEKSGSYIIKFKSNEFYIHPNWNRKTRVNDIALIGLPDSIAVSGYVSALNV